MCQTNSGAIIQALDQVLITHFFQDSFIAITFLRSLASI